ncbi:capsular polysaccharide export protein, LipB/KpsS family [Halomonas organivorans]|uniref:Capsule biosynthesis protein n=1 Tax=Halomonas organivorans TaxID=257772 RepID=A0A7W5G4J8_9GAMM|nr:hypothetical protein [Halomonas organivorans]MBB3140057.1 hypothetical protein [Halomonas organivorans]
MSSNILFLLSVSEPFFTRCMDLFELDSRRRKCRLSAFSYYNYSDHDLSVFDHVVYFKDVLDQMNDKAHAIDFMVESRRMEAEYQFVLSDLIHAERHFARFNKEDAFRVAVLMGLKVEELNKENKVSLIVAEGLDDFLSMFAYFFSRRYEIPFRYPVRSRIGTGVYLSDGLDGNVAACRPSNGNATLNADEYIDNYLEKKEQPSYMVANKRFFKVADRRDFLVLAKKTIQKNKDTTFHAYEGSIDILKKRVFRIVNALNYSAVLKNNRVALKDIVERGVDFFVYPLHFHPEASTLVKGRWINNQLQIIEFISKSLPSNYVLLVKEHRVSIGRRRRDFYREIVKHHNVMLVNHDLNPHDLIRHSTGVVTISSSMGLEAILHNKPVICFGDVFYNRLPGVENARDFTRMQDYVNNAIGFKGYDKAHVSQMVSDILKYSVFPETDFSPHHFTDEHCSALLDLLDGDLDHLVHNHEHRYTFHQGEAS